MDNRRLSTKDMWEKTYDGASASTSYASPETRCGTFELVRIFRKYFPPTPGLRLLEMGCGGSKYLPWFARELGYTVEGIDYTQTGCETARRNLAAAGVSGQVHCEDFLNLPDSYFSQYDIVTSYGVIEHFSEASEVLRAFSKCLRPGGLLLTFVPNMNGLPGHILRGLDRPLFDTHCLFDLQQFKDYHGRAGLEVIHGSYSEWLDLALLPLERLGRAPDLLLKNVVHYANRMRLGLMKRFPHFNPQSQFFCSGMVVVARKLPRQVDSLKLDSPAG